MEVGIGMVTAFVGRDQNKSVEENLEAFGRIWPPIIQFTEEHGVRIAIENCPMLFGREQWPRSLRMWESIMAYPLEYMEPKLPGLGDVDWGRYVSALTDIGYDGFTCNALIG